MGTTFTLDSDLVERLERAARNRGQGLDATFRQVVRIGLEVTEAPAPQARFRVEPHDFGLRAEIDLNRMNHLADELETEEMMRKVER